MRHLYLALTFVAVTGLVLAALVALETLLIRARLGEPVLLQKEEKPGAGDIGRPYAPPAILKFGDRKGEKVISVEADQEQSIFLLHHALNDLDPTVKKFVIAVSVVTWRRQPGSSRSGITAAQSILAAAVVPTAAWTAVFRSPAAPPSELNVSP